MTASCAGFSRERLARGRRSPPCSRRSTPALRARARARARGGAGGGLSLTARALTLPNRPFRLRARAPSEGQAPPSPPPDTHAPDGPTWPGVQPSARRRAQQDSGAPDRSSRSCAQQASRRCAAQVLPQRERRWTAPAIRRRACTPPRSSRRSPAAPLAQRGDLGATCGRGGRHRAATARGKLGAYTRRSQKGLWMFQSPSCAALACASCEVELQRGVPSR